MTVTIERDGFIFVADVDGLTVLVTSIRRTDGTKPAAVDVAEYQRVLGPDHWAEVAEDCRDEAEYQSARIDTAEPELHR